MADPAHDTIAIVDFGGQYVHLIATKLRALGFRALIVDPKAPSSAFQPYKGIILSGSPACVAADGEADWTTAIFDLGLPILGLCYGHHLLAHHYGAEVKSHGHEYGPASLVLSEAQSPLLEGVECMSQVFMSHGDSVIKLPEGFVELAYTQTANEAPHHFAAIGNVKLRRYGLQFHPEVDDTTHGSTILRNFASKICGCTPSWDMQHFLAEQRVRIQKQCEGKEVFLLASGGVDSTVCAWLLHDALGPERLHLLHIDNGFMRLNESQLVLTEFQAHDVSRHVHFVDASEAFLTAVGPAVAPEKKRLAIGNTFIEVFQEQAKKLGLERFLLAQGTIYPDTIESGGTKRADVIKTHHNRVPIIQKMIEEGHVIEPIADLYKAEVRALGEVLGIPDKLIWRHPYPGPGLGVRLLCSEGHPPPTFDAEAIMRLATPVLKRYGLRGLPLPVQSVGVKGDARSYDLPLMLLAEGGYAWKAAADCAVQIFQHCPMINRCVLHLGPDLPSAAAPVAATTTRQRLDTLRLADDLVMRGLARHDLYRTVWQCPTVLVPVRVGDRPGELVVVRPILSERAMTAMPFELPGALCAELVRDVLAVEGVCSLALDVTPKPPGTIEWE